jgi:hypothetical protein
MGTVSSRTATRRRAAVHRRDGVTVRSDEGCETSVPEAGVEAVVAALELEGATYDGALWELRGLKVTDQPAGGRVWYRAVGRIGAVRRRHPDEKYAAFDAKREAACATRAGSAARTSDGTPPPSHGLAEVNHDP